MASFNIVTWNTATQSNKAQSSASNTFDFQSVRIGADNLPITQTGSAETAAFDFGAKKLSNVANPSAAQDAATKNYVDTAVAAATPTGYVKADGTVPMTADLNLDSHKVINVTDPTAAQDAATKNYVDTSLAAYLKLNGTSTMTGDLKMGGNDIQNIGYAEYAAGAGEFAYVQGSSGNLQIGFDNVNGKLVVQGEINATGNKVINVATPTASTDAANMDYVDTQDALKVSKAGDSMTGNLAMNSNKVTGLAAPTNANDAVTKAYADAISSGAVWFNPILDPDLVDDSLSTPPGSPVVGDVYIVGASPTGAWSALAGHPVYWSGTAWVDIKGSAVAIGDRFGVSMESATTAAGGLTSKDNQIATITDATPGAITYTFEVPSANKAVYVGNDLSTHFGHSYNYNGTAWVEFGGPGATNAGTGLAWDGNTLNVLLGAGIQQLPTDEVGIDLYSASGMALVDPGTGLPSSATNAQLSAKLDGTTLAKSSGGLKVNAAGITETELATSVAGHGLSGGAGTALTVALDGSTLSKSASGLKVADAGVTETQLATSVAGNGLTGGAGTALAVVAADGIQVSGSGVAADYTETFTNANAGSVTAGKIAYEKTDGTADLAQATVSGLHKKKLLVVSDSSISAAASGKYFARPGALISGFSALTQGEAVYVSKATAGGITQDLSSFTTGDIVYRVGFAKSATVISFDPEFIIEL